MAGSSSAEQFPDWEWAFIPDITNEAEMEEEVADPCNWTFLAKHMRSLQGSSFTTILRNPWVDDDHDAASLPITCVSPRPFQESMWLFDIQVGNDAVGWLDPARARVLVREIPSPLVLTCCLSETELTFNMLFRTLAGNEVGRDSFPKEDGDQDLSTQEIVFFADDIAHEQNLLSSENQRLCIVLEGLPHLVPHGTVLNSDP